MLKVRKSGDRGQFDHGWLQTAHTFSFGNYFDPNHHHFGSLRVMNEDVIAPGKGFGMHPHADMEIITYVLEGELEHRDSMGNGSVIRKGDFQRMSAGTGIEHSEFNPSSTASTHLYQIWIYPQEKGGTPSYEEMSLEGDQKRNQFLLVASPEQQTGTLTLNQEACIYLAELGLNTRVAHTLNRDNQYWLQVLRGDLQVNGLELTAGDGLAVEQESSLELLADTQSEVMLFEMK